MGLISSSPIKSQQGFTLIEALIAFFVLAVGLLGAVAMQAKAKQASFDSMQRSAAIALGNDIIQRIRANDDTNAATLYNFTINSTDATPTTPTNCYNTNCDAATLATYDKEQWLRAIKASENSGSLDNAVVCINPTQTAGALTNEIALEVIVTWQGRQEMTEAVNSSVSCGTSGNKRRMVVLTSTVHVRS